MYDYRRMTTEERTATVAHRRARGFPLHKPPHFPRELGWYLVTAATYEHRPYFGATNELRALETRLLEAFASANIPCAGWVVLPNHYHALIHTNDLNRVGNAIGPIHGRSSRYVNSRDKTPGRRVWYKFNDRRMRSERHFWASLHYVAHNPVKHGYVDRLSAWPWSCVHELIEEYGSEWLRNLIDEYPLADYGDKWDVCGCSA
jgi:putative transposase